MPGWLRGDWNLRPTAGWAEESEAAEPTVTLCPGRKLDADGVDCDPSPHHRTSATDAVDRLIDVMHGRQMDEPT